MAVVYNHDVAALCRLVQRAGEELHKSVSSGTSGMNSFDLARSKSNIAAVRSLKDWVVAEPQLDLPESHPTAIELPDPVKRVTVESDSVNLLLDICHACEIEMLNSQSAREAAGMNGFDAVRVGQALKKLDSLLDNHVAKAEPLDLVESSPSRPLAGPGKRGT